MIEAINLRERLCGIHHIYWWMKYANIKESTILFLCQGYQYFDNGVSMSDTKFLDSILLTSISDDAYTSKFNVAKP